MNYLRQIGGTRFTSISNNGNGGEEGAYSQCIWIAIRDFLNFHRGIQISALELKGRVGLGPETDRLEFDDDNTQMREALQLVCQRHRINLRFIPTNYDGSIQTTALDEHGNMIPRAVYNIDDADADIVYIATFGGHFELMTNGPNYNLEQHHESLVEPSAYRAKVRVDDEYVDPDTLTDDREKIISSYSKESVEIQQRIDLTNMERDTLKMQKLEKEHHIQSLLESTDFNEAIKKQIWERYNSELEEINTEIYILDDIITSLRQRQIRLEEIINGILS
jgi:hypothetical protein